MWMFLRVYGWMVAFLALAVALLFLLVDPTPPRTNRFRSSGANNRRKDQ